MLSKHCRKWKWSVCFSFLCSICLQIVSSWTNRAASYQPNWVLLILLYWTFMFPRHINIGAGFLMGNILDLISASTLGLHTLSMSIISYLATIKSHLFQNLAYWQQVPVIILLSLTEEIIIFWIEFLVAGFSSRPINLWSSIMNGILWPWLCLLIRRIHQ